MYSAMAFALFVLVGVSLVDGQLTQQQRDDFVNTHNAFRRTVTPTATNMREMSWSTPLEQVAQAYANTCNFQHNGNRNSQAQQRNAGFTQVGENIYATTARTLSARQRSGNVSTTSWDSERNYYTYGSTGGSCQSGKVCGHYTQLAWANSYKIGCGVADCSSIANAFSSGGTIVVCNYGPAGNFRRQAPWKTGSSSCSACPAGVAGLCNNKLCTNTTEGNSAAHGGTDTRHLLIITLLSAIIVRLAVSTLL